MPSSPITDETDPSSATLPPTIDEIEQIPATTQKHQVGTNEAKSKTPSRRLNVWELSLDLFVGQGYGIEAVEQYLNKKRISKPKN